jgi:hypothetical protein
VKQIFVSGLMLWALGAASADACVTARYRFSFGSDTATSMQVASGQSCLVGVGAAGQSTFTSFRISSPPANGTASQSGTSGVVYRSRAGFHGSDAFAFTVTGHGPAGNGSSTIRVSVTVQ